MADHGLQLCLKFTSERFKFLIGLRGFDMQGLDGGLQSLVVGNMLETALDLLLQSLANGCWCRENCTFQWLLHRSWGMRGNEGPTTSNGDGIEGGGLSLPISHAIGLN